MANRVGDYYYYSGAVHIHTTESDGTRSLEEVVAIGQKAGLDFMMFTDHMGLKNRDAGKEGLYDKTLVVIGYEHNDLDENHHYMIFDSPGVYPQSMNAAELVAAVADDDALGIIAHPDERRPHGRRHRPYPWIDWSVEGFNGVELWNQMSEWMEQLTRWNKLAMAFSPRKSMVGPTEWLLGKWDELNRRRKIVGVFAVDAHAFGIRIGPFAVEIFPYKVHFRCLRTHIILFEPLSDDFHIARRQLYVALRDCRVFGSNMRWGVADKFEFVASNGTETATCGGRLSSAENARLFVKVPSRATIRLIADGKTVLRTDSDELEYVIQKPGIYRVEAWKGKRGWIFSNHIRIAV